MQGFVNNFVVFVAPVLVIVAAVRRDVLLCAWTLETRGGHRPLRNERRGVSQADAGAGVRLAGVVTPRKRS